MQAPKTPLLLVSILCSMPAPAQELPAESPRISTYEMDVELLPAERTVRGTQRITWRNDTRSPTDELWFHLYLNAFSGPGSTVMRESAPEFRELWREDEFGGIVVDRIELPAAGDETPVALEPQFASPDDGNPDDRTVFFVRLPRPVGPGESITLETSFTSRMPKAYRRTGWIPENGFFCMHWYPKLAVFEQRGDRAEWNCHQFHANTEFFSDYSVYRVTIDVPVDYEVGATGGVPAEEVRGDRKLLTFEQADVHDFAFVADPDFRRHKETFGPLRAADDPTGVAQAVAGEMGVPVSTFDLPETQIVLLLHPQHDTQEQVDRHMRAVKCALEFFGLRYGAYPYPAITVVDPGEDLSGRVLGGGMEYPTLITCGTTLYPHPRRTRPEGVTVHEFGHQYWYGLSGNNEFEESWLDEGINSYSEGRAQWLQYNASMRPIRTSDHGLLTVSAAPAAFAGDGVLGPIGRLPTEILPLDAAAGVESVGWRGTLVPESPLIELLAYQPTATAFQEASFEDFWNDRDRMLSGSNPDAMVRRGWEYISRESYSINSYTRPATILRTLERMVGRGRWWTFMRRFHAQARFGHPTTEDFVAMLGRECGAGPAEFFRLATQAGAEFDYGVESVTPPDGRGPSKSVVVRRFGGISADVRVRFTFAGRAEPVWQTIPAATEYPWTRITFTTDANGQPYGRLLEVWVDPPPDSAAEFEAGGGPAGVFLIDRNLLNNAWRAEPDRGPAFYRGVRMLLQTQQQFSFSGLIG